MLELCPRADSCSATISPLSRSPLVSLGADTAARVDVVEACRWSTKYGQTLRALAGADVRDGGRCRIDGFASIEQRADNGHLAGPLVATVLHVEGCHDGRVANAQMMHVDRDRALGSG